MEVSKTSRKGGNKMIFPQKLWKLVNDEQYNDVIGWNEDGSSFFVNVKELKANFLGKSAKSLFHTKEPKSFVRQLHMYGFRKIGPNMYTHKFFRRNDEAALLKIKRKYPPKVLGDSTNVQQQPDAHQRDQQHLYHNQHEPVDQENSGDILVYQANMDTASGDSEPSSSASLSTADYQQKHVELYPEQQIMVMQPYEINGNYGYAVDQNQIISANIAPRQVSTITYAHHVMYDYTDIDIWMTFPELTNELTLEELTSAYSRSYLDGSN